MGVTFTIGGVDRLDRLRFDSLAVDKQDAVERCTFATQAIGDLSAGAYRPSLGDVVRITSDGELIFGGTVEDVQDEALRQPNAGGLVVRVTALGYHQLAEWKLFTGTFAEGTTALEVVGTVCALLSTYYGVTNLTPGPGGPTLPALTFDHVPCRQVFDQVTKITGWPWRINGDKGFSCVPPGTHVGATFSDANATVLRHFSWSRPRTTRITRAWAKCGAEGRSFYMQAWSSTSDVGLGRPDGTRVRFLLACEPLATFPRTVREIRGGVPTDYEVGAGRWTFDVTRVALVQVSGPALGVADVLECTFDVEYPVYCRAEDEAAVDAGDLRERVFAYPEVWSLPHGVALAAGELRTQKDTPKTVRLTTRVVNPWPFQQCMLSFPGRLVSGSYLIRGVRTRPFGVPYGQAQALVSEVELVEGSEKTPSYLDYWREKLGPSAGTTSPAASAGSGGSLTVIQGTPPRPYLGGSEDFWTRVATANQYERVRGSVDQVLDSTQLPGTIYCDVNIKVPAGVTATVRVVAGGGIGGSIVWNQQETVGTGTPSTATEWTWQPIEVHPRAGVHAYRIEVAANQSGVDVGVMGASLRW